MNNTVLAAIEQMQRRDFETRQRLLQQDALYGDYAEEMQQVHRENAQQLDRIIAAHGWPGIAEVGIDGARAAWMVAQHAICTPDLQRKFLGLLEAAVARGDAAPLQAAMLADRIRFNEGRPQRYGTVLDWDESGELNCEVEDPAGLDARRAALGLAPFAQDLALHRAEVAAEGGRAPESFAAYREKALAWAKSVGWR
jgi:hypothetical protein